MATAMVRRDLRSLPSLEPPAGLELRRVLRSPDDGSDGVLLEHAVAAAVRADPRIQAPGDAFAGHLRSLPSTVRLFAAVDADGVVRATSGCDALGEEAIVFFVNTDPEWRGRGLGQTMTVLALRASRDRCARRVSLDATGAARRMYERLGFESITKLARFRSSR
jgi:ribosomal protein S18 acetylase RimI-like enzyme